MSPLVKSNWKTHCLGRHLVDAPADAKIRCTTKVFKDTIERSYSLSPSTLKAFLDKRERELRLQKHQTEGTVFVDRLSHGSSTTLVYWKQPFSTVLLTMEAYFVPSDGRNVFKYVGDVSPTRKARGEEINQVLAQSLSSRNQDAIPAGPGFCIDGGLISGNVRNTESFSAAIWLAGKPDVQLSVSAFVQGKVEPGLLERAGGFLPGLLSVAGGINTLRKGKHPVGPIYGEEILTAGTENGKRLYAFKWEAPGKANSLAEPNINVSMGVVESQYETNAESFASDDEALAMWDAIVDSIRLRPGAV